MNKGGFMKKYYSHIILLLLMITVIPVMGQDAKISGDWEYTANKTGWTITDYRGNASEIEIPSAFEETPVTALDASLFTNDMSLTKIIIPDSVTAIGKAAFQGCSALNEVILSNMLKAIPDSCFKYCTALEQITLPGSLTSIGKESFADCVRLQDVVIPSAVRTIGESAFENCQSLTDVFLSRKLTGIGGHAFRDTPWFDAQTDEFVIIGGGILIKYNGSQRLIEIPYGTTMIADAFEGNITLESVDLPDSVTQIGQYAFKDALNLTSVNIPKLVTAIGSGAFQGCRSLPEIVIPESVKTIGADAFNGCERLTELIIPENVTVISARTAANCSDLVDIRIPDGVTKIDKTAFTGSPNVQIKVAPGSQAEKLLTGYEIPYSYYLMEKDGFVYNRDNESVQIIKYTGMLYDVEIPAMIDGLPVTAVGAAAFQNNPDVRRVIVPLTVKTIGDWAFSYMDSLETVELDLGIESIGADAFTGSSNLWEIRIPKGVKEFGGDPIGAGSKIKICAAEGSQAASLLQGFGIRVFPENSCGTDYEVLDRWAVANLTIGSACDTVSTGSTKVSSVTGGRSTVEVIRIPDGMTKVDEDMLLNAGSDIILIVPPSVGEIDEVILSGRTVTLVGDAGTAAEKFARAHDVKFIVRVKTWIND